MEVTGQHANFPAQLSDLILQVCFVYLTNAPGVTLPQTDSKSFVYTENFESVAYTLTTRMHLELVLNDRVWQLYIS